MRKTGRSVAEITVHGFIGRMEELRQESRVTNREAEKLIGYAFKVLAKCEELRISRDNWSNRFELSNQKVKELKAENVKLRKELKVVKRNGNS